MNTNKKTVIKIFVLVFIMVFLFLPNINIISAQLNSEEIIKNQDLIELKNRDAYNILDTLKQEFAEEWEKLTSSSEYFDIREQAILVSLRKAFEINSMQYILTAIGKDGLEFTLKIANLIISKDPRLIIKEIERMTVDQAKNYAMDWLLQKEMKVAKGNLDIYYPVLAGGWEKVIFPYIIVYQPINFEQGKVAIGIYSSEIIKTPEVSPKYPWEGGIYELPPFIIEITGEVEKNNIGFGSVYRWIKGPEINIVFNQPVPKFEFNPPTILERIETYFNKAIVVLNKIKELGQGLIETIFSGFSSFEASVSPDIEYLSQNNKPAFDESSVSETGEEEISEIVEDVIQKSLEKISVQPETLSEGELEQFEEMLDDIAERIDILSQQIAGLVGSVEQGADKVDKAGKVQLASEIIYKNPEQFPNNKNEEIKESEENKTIITTTTRRSSSGSGNPPEPFYCSITGLGQASMDKVVFDEIAWMGTSNSSNDEWIKLKNISSNQIDLSNWQIIDKDSQIKIIFNQAIIPANSFYLLERTDDDSLPGVAADLIYTGALNDTNEALYLFDNNCLLQDKITADPDWPGGDKENKTPMKRNQDLTWYEELEPEPEEDVIPPQVVFNLEPIQTSLSFEIFFKITDNVLNTATPSGLDGFIFRWKEEGGDWQEDDYQNIADASLIYNGQKEFTGEDEKTYTFQIKAKNKTGNESQWFETLTTVILTGSEEASRIVVINEIAWMGTKASSSDEWIELFNNTDQDIDLSGWKLKSSDPKGPEINFGDKNTKNPIIFKEDFYLIERTNDDPTSEVADWYGSFGNGLGNNPDCEILFLYDSNDNLIDKTGCLENGYWFAGDKEKKISMERIDSMVSGFDPENWANNDSTIAQEGSDADGNPIFGTPKAKNSAAFLGKIIYVDDDFEDDPDNHRWNTIQEGIGDAQEKWIVIVKDGTYIENIKIEIPNVLLRSEAGAEATIIQTADRSKHILEIKAEQTEIRGFTIKGNTSYQMMAGIYADNMKNLLIKENKFSENFIGLRLAHSTENTVQNNVFEENRWGVYLENSQTNSLFQNIINSQHYSYQMMTCGIYLNYSDNNIIRKNQANDRGESTGANGHGPSNGICLISSDNNIIENNASQNNKETGDGIYLKDSDSNQLKENFAAENQIGINLVNSNGNSLENNKTENNNIGIYLDYNSNENILKNNLMNNNCIANLNTVEPNLNNEINESNLVDGKAVYYLKNQSDLIIDSSFNPGLIYCFNCQNITIKNLTIDSRNNVGIYFYRASDSFIENVKISESIAAIYLEESHNNTIKGNLVKKNFRGISLLMSDKNKILENITEENDSQGYSPCFGTSPGFGLGLGRSNENEISNNLIINNPTGISLTSFSNNNTFFGNTTNNNENGVEVYCSANNLFYHNNFIDNSRNEWGSCTPYSPQNQWYHLDLNQGNYYSDYDELEEGCNDSDNDNICDAYYPKNNDERPFLEKNGWQK